MIKIEMKSFFDLKNRLLIDVRSPCEFEQGHIDGAVNIPLFSNDERALVGTTYKQIGKSEAVKVGLEIVGPKLRFFVEEVEKLRTQRQNVVVHCFRGGMRSQSFSWLLSSAGISNQILHGGYKEFRGYARNFFDHKLSLNIVGGLTGSGKSDILSELSALGEQVIDLEKLANHKGSVFGHLGLGAQPTNEQFENNLFCVLRQLDLSRPIWLEDEAQRIGQVVIPENFFKQMRVSQLIQIEVPIEQRIDRLMRDYGAFSAEALIEAITRIEKKLGGDRYKALCNLIAQGNVLEAIKMMLEYYDKMYLFGMSKRDSKFVSVAKMSGITASEHAQELKKMWK